MLKNEIINLTKKLVSIDSSKQEGQEQCIKIVKDFFRQEKVFIKTYTKNKVTSVVVSTRPGKKFDLILSGHLDVVPADKKMFKPVIKNGKMQGRGAADMKGPDASMIFAFRDLSRLPKPPSVALMLTNDEEVGGYNGTEYLLKEEKYSSKFAFVPDGGTALNKIILRKKGILHIKLTARGKSAHGSRPFLGENAIEKLLKDYNKIRKILPTVKERKWVKTMNLGYIKGGQVINKVPDQAEMGLDIRYTRKQDQKNILSKLKEAKVNFEIINQGSVFLQNKNHPFVSKYKKIAQEVLGKEIEFGMMEGSADARFFSELNIPTIITRTNGDFIHSENEYVEADSLLDLYNIVFRLGQEI